MSNSTFFKKENSSYVTLLHRIILYLDLRPPKCQTTLTSEHRFIFICEKYVQSNNKYNNVYSAQNAVALRAQNDGPGHI